MSAPLSSDRPVGLSSATERAVIAHPDSDYQSARKLPWGAPTPRNGGAVTGRVYRGMILECPESYRCNEKRRSYRKYVYVRGNPDMFGPDQPLVQEKPQRIHR